MHALLKWSALLIPVMLMAVNAWAVPITVDFDSDDTSNPNPGQTFTSVDSSLVHFGDTNGPDLFLADALISPNGTNALAVFFDDDGSALRIDFDFRADMLSFDFGTAAVSPVIGAAILTLFSEGAQVDQVPVSLVQDGTLGQTLLYDTGILFDAVEFEFVNPELTEVVDNLTVNAIPEPSAALVFGLGSIVCGRACGRRPRVRRR
ncbi:MAG: hypothetical protein JRG96_00240 [Deltaproteobacteria bacterium]|nr:hypothetical protein [Deltaproteobacteria bacterium]MBW2418055.1 hypothetical protein [Deltaproteobacteria bacterium]